MQSNQRGGIRGRSEKPRKEGFEEKVVSKVDHCEGSGRIRFDVKITGRCGHQSHLGEQPETAEPGQLKDEERERVMRKAAGTGSEI